MLRSLAVLARATGPSIAATVPLEASAVLQVAGPASTLGSLRSFASGHDPSSSNGDAGAASSAPAATSSSSGGSSGRLGGKEWRSWIDTKLDSKLEAINQQAGGAAAAPAAAAEPSAPPAAAADQPRSKAAKGWELEQQIYSIVAASPRSTEAGTLPEGVTSIAQLAMAGDAPRFARAGSNLAEVSPLRLHPTRLFFPSSTYSPVELDPYKTSEDVINAPFEAPHSTVPTLTPHEVAQLADYKNAPMLSTFLSEAGKLPLRQRTHLRAKLHRHLARQVKIARCMAILSPTARWEPAAPAREEMAAQREKRRQQRQQRQQQQQRQRQ